MNKSTYKVINLFGEEEVKLVDKQAAKPNLFNRYDDFIDKFEAKKTTDDCYTPDDVYQIVVDYVNSKYDLSNSRIIRPFYPGGDYEAVNYPPDSIVIDNPPFSIISQIARFYIERGIMFFLFAPHLTLFGSDLDCTHLVVGASITYENGAVVKTSFLSNVLGPYKVIGDSQLHRKFKELNDSKKVELPKYQYPKEVLTVSHVAYMVEKGVDLYIEKGKTTHCRQLAAQKIHNKGIFGSGFLLSTQAAAEKAAAEKAAAEKAAADRVNVITWQLSEKELAIIKQMDDARKA